MTRAAIVLLADTESKEGLGRMSNALSTVREFKEEGQKVTLLFDEAGTKWIGELTDPDHKYSGHFESVKDEVEGAPALIARGLRRQGRGARERSGAARRVGGAPEPGEAGRPGLPGDSPSRV